MAEELPRGYSRTGVFASQPQQAVVRELINRPPEPMIWLGLNPPASPHATLMRTIYEFALASGLPEVQGEYGIDLESNGEFIKVEGQ